MIDCTDSRPRAKVVIVRCIAYKRPTLLNLTAAKTDMPQYDIMSFST